jgi:hypothetical protein
MGRFDINGLIRMLQHRSVTPLRLRSHEHRRAWPHHKSERRKMSFFIKALNGTFTVLKNSRFHPPLVDQINRGAIVAP